MNLKYNPYLLYIAFWFANRLQEFETTAVQKKKRKNKKKTKDNGCQVGDWRKCRNKVLNADGPFVLGAPMHDYTWYLIRLIYVVLTTSQTVRWRTSLWENCILGENSSSNSTTLHRYAQLSLWNVKPHLCFPNVHINLLTLQKGEPPLNMTYSQFVLIAEWM